MLATTGIAGSGADIEAGEYATSLADGFFRLGGNPDGTITADIKGSADATYINQTADIIQRILENQYNFDSTDMDLGSFASLNTDNSSEVGIWVGAEQRSGLAVISELLVGVSGFGGFNRFNKFSVGIFKAATGDSSLDFDKTNILKLEAIELPRGLSPPNWRRQVGYQKNYTPQTDIAGSVADDHRAFIVEQYRISVSSDSSVLNNFTLATDPPFVKGLYAQKADADTEASRLLTLYKGKHHLFRIEMAFPFKLNINDVIKITYPRFGLDNGKLGRIVALEDDADNYTSTIEVFV